MKSAPLPQDARVMAQEFLELYREHFVFVWRTLLRLGIDVHDCEDAAQEVFVTAFRRWPVLSTASSRRGWLFGVVRRVASRDRRRQDRRERRIDALARVTSEPLDLERLACEREAWARLTTFLDALDADKREAFVLGELEELGRHDLGVMLGVNPNTAYSRLQAARRRFLAHFAADTDDTCARMLADAAAASSPCEEQRRRVLRSITPLVLPAANPTVPGTAEVLRTWTVSLSLATCVTIAIAAAGASANHPVTAADAPPPPIVAGSARASTTEPRPASIPAEVRGAVAPAPATVQHPRASQARGREPSTRPKAAATEPASSVASDSRFAAELDLLLAARAAMLAERRDVAQNLLAEHRQRFGGGAMLAEVREQISRDLASGAISSPGSGDLDR